MNLLNYSIQYLKHLSKAQGKYYLHSPFVYALSEAVIYDKRRFYAFDDVEVLRRKLMLSDQSITVTDYGAGSKIMKGNTRTIKQIAQHATATPQKGQLLFRLVNYFQPKTILEVGTSIGISAMYMAFASRTAKVHTIEGCPQTAQVAMHNFNIMQLQNIQTYVGTFEAVLPRLLPTISPLDMVYLDGNHQLQATLDYFRLCVPYMNENTVLILDDIHWSEEMQNAWQTIQTHPDVSITLDLFKLGIVFFKKKQAKQDFKLWF